VTKERRLGRGLEALLGMSGEGAPQAGTTAEHAAGTSQEEISTIPLPVTHDESGQQWLELGLLERNPYQPREHFDEAEIADLCDSIRAHGFLQPIIARKHGEKFQIIAGERRFRAAQLANWERVPVQIREVDDRQMAELAIVENVQRKDLNALEKAASFQRYMQEYGCTQEDLAARVNIDRSTVANLVRLLELPEEVKNLLSSGDLTQGHARALLPLGDEEEQKRFALTICQDALSVRATEQLVQDHIRHADGGIALYQAGPSGSSTGKSVSPPSHLAELEEQLRLALGTKVDLKQTAKGRGRITIHFKNNEEFERLREILTDGSTPLRDAG